MWRPHLENSGEEQTQRRGRERKGRLGGVGGGGQWTDRPPLGPTPAPPLHCPVSVQVITPEAQSALLVGTQAVIPCGP